MAWRKGALLTALMKLEENAAPPAPEELPPPPPLPLRLRKLARFLAPRPLARSVRVPADDKLKTTRLLLTPFAALVMRSDGALYRVCDVRKQSGYGEAAEGMCVIELAGGADAYMLARHPLPPEEVHARAGRGSLRSRRGGGPPKKAGSFGVGADELVPSAYPLMVPGFFGGDLKLRNGLEVRVVDADFGDWRKARAGALGGALPPGEPPPPNSGLLHVKIVMIDGPAGAVHETKSTAGRAVWCDVHELLESLSDGSCLVPTVEAEEGLRRRARLELHRAEQRRLALTALKQSEAEPRMSLPDDSMRVLGVHGLLAQLDAAAPTPLIEAGEWVSHGLKAGKGGLASAGDHALLERAANQPQQRARPASAGFVHAQAPRR